MTDEARGELYTREDGTFGWRLKAFNGNIIATDGGQGYENATECVNMFVSLFPSVDLVDMTT